MKTWRFALHFYRRTLRQPLRIGSQLLTQRTGFWIEGFDPEGRRHVAECAPLPGLHEESLDEAAAVWRRWMELPEIACNLSKLDLDAPYWGLLPWAQEAPAVQSSMEMLLLSYLLQERAEIFPAESLSPNYQMCGLLQLPQEADAVWWKLLEGLRAQKFSSIKVKIGRSDPELEMQRLREVYSVLGMQIKLRLDANQKLDAESLARWQDFLRDGSLEFIEDPLPPGAVVPPGPWTLARDEGAVAFATDELPVDMTAVAVIKPNVVRLSRYLKFLRAASQRPQRLCVSNTYESPLSLQVYAWLYSRYVSKPLALGFGTEQAFSDQGMTPFGWRLQAQGRWPETAFSDFRPEPWSHIEAKL